MKNERTSKRVASDAASIMRMTDEEILNIARQPRGCARIRRVAASAVTQARDKRDDRGFDPRDGGKIGREFIPKSPQVRKAMKGKLGKHKPTSSPFYPSARPLKNGP